MSTTNTTGNWVTTWDRSGREIECHDPTIPVKRSEEATQKPSDKNSKPK